MDGFGDNATYQHRHQHRHEASDYRRIELITGTARRRRWTAEEKAAVFIPLHVEGPGERTDEALAAAALPSSPVVAHSSLLVIESSGLRVRFSGPVDAAALRLVLTHFGRRA